MTINNNMGSSDLFYTFDLGLASVLITMGQKIVDIDKKDKKKVKFIFQYSNDLDETIERYWDNKLKINARAFLDNQKMLKNRIYSK